MKGAELRIGNLVFYESTIDDHEPKQINGSDIAMFEDFKDRYSPIPLTQQWLLKLGFNKDYKSGYIGIDVCNTDFVLLTPENETASHAGKYRWAFKQDRIPLIKEIESVHELQNLFYAVSGVELILKEL